MDESKRLRPSTIKQTLKRLRFLTAKCNTNEPEEVKQFVAAKQCYNSYKECLIESYAIYMKSIGRQWKKPFYRTISQTRKPNAT